MTTVLTVIEGIRRQIAAHDDALSEARERRDAVFEAARTFPGVLRTSGTGSLTTGYINHPVDDADGVMVLDRRAYPKLGPDGDGELPHSVVEDIQNYIRPILRQAYPGVRRNQRVLRTDRGVMVEDRDHWTIHHIHPDGSVTVAGRKVRLPADYTRDHLELGYAQTSHATQGRTVDIGILLVDGPIDSRGLYTAITRGRHTSQAFVVADAFEAALDMLTQALTRDWMDQPAIAREARRWATLEHDLHANALLAER